MNDLNTRKIINYIKACTALILFYGCIVSSNVFNDDTLSIFWTISAVFYLVIGIFIGRKTK